MRERTAIATLLTLTTQSSVGCETHDADCSLLAMESFIMMARRNGCVNGIELLYSCFYASAVLRAGRKFQSLSYRLALSRLDESSDLVQALLTVVSFYAAANIHRLDAITVLVETSKH